ncbi:MAG TPA: alpha/beta hydrolase [Actinophytocola sp.]|jgi:pimeloyl-ACP methyl ester carboxylesterase|nr:alpha/beta hydrolase [Actinophytocola sp.]
MDRRYWRDEALGTPRELALRGGRLRVFEAGAGEPLVFVHGALVNANLWRKVVPLLARDFRCVTLDLPLGSHELPVPDADLSTPGLADLIAEAVTALDLPAPTLVANDTGGALTQVALARHPKLAARLVLTSCDAYENFPPRLFRILLAPTRIPALARVLFAPLRLRFVRSSPLGFGLLMRSRLDERAGDSYVLPILTEPAVGADFARFTPDTRYTFEAIAALRTQDRPTLLAWSRDDRFFPPAQAKRLAADIPGARLEWIDDAYTFSMEDQPARLAELIAGFVRESPVA